MPALKRSASTNPWEDLKYNGPTPMKKRKIAPKKENLGRITGNIPAGKTTLALAPGPFTGKKYVTFLYENALQQIAGAANVMTAVCKPNDMFDFDNSGDAGNKQPLYYDTLLTASGPYKQYKVLSWKTTYWFVNTSTCAVDIFVSPPIAATSEFDSLAEADNFPGVKRLRLTPGTGSRSYGSITIKGNVKDVFPTGSTDMGLIGAYNASPANIVYQAVLVRGSDGSTAPSIYWSVKHEAYTELSYVDSIVS